MNEELFMSQLSNEELNAFADAIQAEEEGNIEKEEIILYHQNGCGMCKAVEMLLKKKGIQFESRLITVDNVEEAQKLGIMGTPTLVVGDQMFVKKQCLDWINAR